MKQLVGDDAARGIDLALTPVVFGVIGWFLDGWLGTGPWLMVGCVAFALVGTVAKLWYGYDAEMREHERTGPWARRSAPADGAEDGTADLWADRKRQR